MNYRLNIPQLIYILLLLFDGVHSRNLTVGMLFAYNDTSLTLYVGYKKHAAAALVAYKRIEREQLLPDITNVDFVWTADECVDAASVRALMDMQSTVDVILGPACGSPAIYAGTAASYYDFPIILWGPPYDASLESNFNFPTVMSTSMSARPRAVTIVALLQKFGWKDISFLYTTDRNPLVGRCENVFNALSDYLNLIPDINIAYYRKIQNNTVANLQSRLNLAAAVSRVMIICFESPVTRRNFFLAAHDNGYDSNDYTYIFIEEQSTGFQTFSSAAGINNMWVDYSTTPDGRDRDALSAARRAIVLDVSPYNDTASFVKEVIAAFKEPPFDCDDCTDVETSVSRVAQFHDAMYLYALARNKTVQARPSMAVNMSGSTLLTYSMGVSFAGQSGIVKINSNGTRDPSFVVYTLSSTDTNQIMLQIDTNLQQGQAYRTTKISELFTSESQMWVARGGMRPLNQPKCGFGNDQCPLSFQDQYLAFVIAAVALFVVIVILLVLVFCWVIRSRQREEARQNLVWQISFGSLIRPSQKSHTASRYSLQSSLTTSTRMTMDSKKETDLHAFFFLGNDAVVARKHQTRHYLSKKETLEMRQLHNIDHDNVNKFVGICEDGPQFMTIWRYCGRGSLRDVIEKGTLQMDWFFKFSIMRDISEGLHYLHHSVLGAHGWLSSGTCLVDERWQLKITYHGCKYIKATEMKTAKNLLWTAPELIREVDPLGTKAGDIYSFAIICSEIVTRKSAWNVEESHLDIDEVIYKLKRGGKNPPRPDLSSDADSEVNSSMLLLIKDCWAEDPAARPNSDQVRALVKSINHGRSANLMDHVFNVLEQYASNLEEEVESRMKELVEEKKKSDILLYRMLPRQVAEKLKLGQAVEPEGFDCVTIFFSDVVSFTTLASRSTPIQVVNLLNDLYSTFDAIIDEHDVYKVETIGDGYLCVSGLPHRNGNEHAKEVAEMSKALLNAIRRFKIPHLPTEKIQIRIGMHTGPSVAGVVGITMPRYCLFGDSVNTAARMESNGKPMRIHISAETNHFLIEVIGGYRTELRGEVIIKGKGTIETYWLLEDDQEPGGSY